MNKLTNEPTKCRMHGCEKHGRFVHRFMGMVETRICLQHQEKIMIHCQKLAEEAMVHETQMMQKYFDFLNGKLG